MPAWVSNVVNRVRQLGVRRAATPRSAIAAVDNAYLQTRYEIGARPGPRDDAAVFRAVASRTSWLWNHRLQTPPYRHRRVSLNRRQTVLPKQDGTLPRWSSRTATRASPNWLDAAGLPTGMIFWRFLLPEENPPPIEAEVVPVDSLKS